MKFIFIFVLAVLFFPSRGHTQFLKQKLEEIKLAAKQKVNDRIDQKSNQAMDSVMDKSERTVGEKMKSKKKKKKQKQAPEETIEQINAPAENKENTGSKEDTEENQQTNKN